MEDLHERNRETDVAKNDPSVEFLGNWIGEIMKAAILDFQMLSSLLKDYGQLFDARMAPEAAERISQSVKELQCMDIFIQKLTHMNRLNGVIRGEVFPGMEIPGDNDWHLYSGIIFRLNYFQSVAASFDFASIVSGLKMHLNEFHCHIMKVPGVSFSDADYFRHNDLIVTKLRLLTAILSDLSKKYWHAGMEISAAPRERLLKIETIYSIESERYVFLWLMEHAQGTEVELLDKYSRFSTDTNHHTDDHNIELF